MRRPGRAEKALVVLLPAVFAAGWLAPGAAREPVGADVVLAFADERILESSGLVARGGLVVTVNDSGDGNRVFAVDPATGGTVGVSSWPGEAVDVEALAPSADAPGKEVLVGDIGDNTASREEVSVTRVAYGRGDADRVAERWRFAYSDGPHDAETLLVDPATGRIHVVVKEFAGRVYQAPAELDPSGVNELTPLPEGRVLGVATDGAFFPDGRHVVLRNYGQAAVYSWPGLEHVATFELPAQPQGEGIAVTEDGEVLISSEGRGAEVLRIELPDDVRAALADAAAPVAPPSEDDRPAGHADARDGAEATPVDADDRDWRPWALGGLLGLVAVGVLVRSLRPR